ncbi:hypothetical protein PtB15_3B532 [Puccinia triticina]|nr:hypothetical protein PtB15_3B532 [Puccinia triticina]
MDLCPAAETRHITPIQINPEPCRFHPIEIEPLQIERRLPVTTQEQNFNGVEGSSSSANLPGPLEDPRKSDMDVDQSVDKRNLNESRAHLEDSRLSEVHAYLSLECTQVRSNSHPVLLIYIQPNPLTAIVLTVLANPLIATKKENMVAIFRAIMATPQTMNSMLSTIIATPQVMMNLMLSASFCLNQRSQHLRYQIQNPIDLTKLSLNSPNSESTHLSAGKSNHQQDSDPDYSPKSQDIDELAASENASEQSRISRSSVARAPPADSDSPQSASDLLNPGGEDEVSESQGAHNTSLSGAPDMPVWTPGHLLTKKQILEILKQHNVPHKGRDKKEILVKIYTRFCKSEDQAKKQSNSDKPIPSTAPNEPNQPQVISEATIASTPRCVFEQFLNDELRELLEPFSTSTGSLSRNKLILLCDSYVNRNQPLKIRNCAHLQEGVSTPCSNADDQLPMDVDSPQPILKEPCESTVAQSEPMDWRLSKDPPHQYGDPSEPADLNASPNATPTLYSMELTEVNLQGGSDTRSCQPAKLTTSQKTPRGGRLAELVRMHVRTLFGLKTKQKIPPPLSKAEAQKWVDHPESNSEDSGCSTIESNGGTDDSPFPYPDGPGHANATLSTLKFLRWEMDRYGVSSFRPDLAKPWGSPQNSFLWNLAIKTFIQLVKRGEYSGISLDQYSRTTIQDAIRNHVVHRWQKP